MNALPESMVNGDHVLTNVNGKNSASNQGDRENQALITNNNKKRKHEESEDSSTGEPIIEIAKVSYKNFFITIFTEDVTNPKRFFFEPLVLLDPKSIISESHGFLQQDVVCLTIQMWNPEIRSKVLDRLRSLPRLSNLNVHEDDIYVLPFEEVQLVHKPGSNGNIHQSIRLLDEPKRYHRLSESLHFYLLCDSTPTANAFAEDFRRNPDFLLEISKLALECRGLSLGYPIGNRPNFKYNVAISQNATVNQDLEAELGKRKGLSFIPVFSVSECTNPDEENCQFFAYSTFEHETNTDYGDFDLSEELFTVKTAGIYQFNFSGAVLLDSISTGPGSGSDAHFFELIVDNVMKAFYRIRMASDEENGYFPSFSISALLQLVPGQKVGVQQIEGMPLERGNDTTKFTGLFLTL